MNKSFLLILAFSLLIPFSYAEVTFGDDAGCCKSSYTDSAMSCQKDSDCDQYPPKISFGCDKTAYKCDETPIKEVCSTTSKYDGCIYQNKGCNNGICTYSLSSDTCLSGTVPTCTENSVIGCCGESGSYVRYKKSDAICCSDGVSKKYYVAKKINGGKDNPVCCGGQAIDPTIQHCCKDGISGAATGSKIYVCKGGTSYGTKDYYGNINFPLKDSECCCSGKCCTQEKPQINHVCQKCQYGSNGEQWFADSSMEGTECTVSESGSLVCGACVKPAASGGILDKIDSWFGNKDYLLQCTPNSAPELKTALVFQMKDGSLQALTRDEAPLRPYIPLEGSAEYDFTNAESVFVSPLNLDNNVFYQNHNSGLKILASDGATAQEDMTCEFNVESAKNALGEEYFPLLGKTFNGKCSDLSLNFNIPNENLPLTITGTMTSSDDGSIVSGGVCKDQNKKSVSVKKSFVVCPSEVDYKSEIVSNIDIITNTKLVPGNPDYFQPFNKNPDYKISFTTNLGNVKYSEGDGIPNTINLKIKIEGNSYNYNFLGPLFGEKGLVLKYEGLSIAREGALKYFDLNAALEDIQGARYSNEEIKNIINSNTAFHNNQNDAAYVTDEIFISINQDFNTVISEKVTITQKGQSKEFITAGNGDLIYPMLKKLLKEKGIALTDSRYQEDIAQFKKDALYALGTVGEDFKFVYYAAVLNMVACPLANLEADDTLYGLRIEGNLYADSGEENFKKTGKVWARSTDIDISSQTGNKGDTARLEINNQVDKGNFNYIKTFDQCRAKTLFGEEFAQDVIKCQTKAQKENEQFFQKFGSLFNSIGQ